MKFAASILFLSVAAAAQTADHPDERSTGAQQGDSQTTNGSHPAKKHKSKKARRHGKSESMGATSDANTSKAPVPSDGAQPNAPETTHQSQPPPERSKPDGTAPSP